MTEGEEEEEARETALGRDLNAFHHFFVLLLKMVWEGGVGGGGGREGGRDGWREGRFTHTYLEAFEHPVGDVGVEEQGAGPPVAPVEGGREGG